MFLICIVIFQVKMLVGKSPSFILERLLLLEGKILSFILALPSLLVLQMLTIFKALLIVYWPDLLPR